jgi:hypothetical protein
MAVEKLFGALPLHYFQLGISKYGSSNVLLALLVTVAAGILVDYIWMLYLRTKMVCVLITN